LLAQVQNLKRDLAIGTAVNKEGLIEALRSCLVVDIQTADKAARSQSGNCLKSLSFARLFELHPVK